MTDRTGDYAKQCAKDYWQIDTNDGKQLNAKFLLVTLKLIYYRRIKVFNHNFLLFLILGFCKNALVSIVADFNEGAFDCDCKPPGALG